jgi:DNA adenine methylase
MASTAKPVLKWVGGKTQILDTVLAHFPHTIQDYHEPFLGGGSVLIELLQTSINITGTVYASDINPNLITMYRNIQARPRHVINALRVLQREYQQAAATDPPVVNREAATPRDARSSAESYYFWVRRQFNALEGEKRETPLASAMLIFLNKTCFRGLYREGPHGFNVPFGNYKNPTILDETNILVMSALIQDVEFKCQSFEAALARVKAGDFVYLDPPYVPEKATSFTGYTADGFPLAKHDELFRMCKALPCGFLMSNAATPLVAQAFPSPQFQTVGITARRAINSKNPEAETQEVLISREK